MSSDKSPEKLVWVQDNDTKGTQAMTLDLVVSYETILATYIREDLLQISAVNEAITQMQVEYHEKIDRLNDELKLAKLDQRERITCQSEVDEQRRREMFEKVALTAINGGADWDAKGFNTVVSHCAEQILKAADKFARGEE